MIFIATKSLVLILRHLTTWPKVPWPRNSRIRYLELGMSKNEEKIVILCFYLIVSKRKQFIIDPKDVIMVNIIESLIKNS